jgi:DNA primase
VAGFGGRILGPGEPKYLNSPETPIFTKSRILFGLFHHRESIRQARTAVIVEGNFDMVSLALHGVRNVAAPLGTALTPAQVRVLKGYTDEVILLFDGDSAGLKAALHAVEIFLTEQVRARVAVLPQGHDPDSFIREHGREQLEKYLHEALPLPEFVFDRLVAKHGVTLEGKGLILKELRPVIEALANNRCSARC